MKSMPKKKRFGWKPKSRLLIRVQESIFGILAINFVFQGVRGMQSKELTFRIILQLILIIIFFCLINIINESNFICFTLSFVSGHAFNWVFNTHLWVCLRYMKIYKRNPDALRTFLNKVADKLNNKAWVDEAVCIGSVGDKGDVSSWRSDIDLRLFFKPGFINFLRMNFYLIYLRTWALFTIIPLDLYAYDDIEYLARFKSGEGIKVIKDVNNRIKLRFSDRVMC